MKSAISVSLDVLLFDLGPTKLTEVKEGLAKTMSHMLIYVSAYRPI